MTIKFNTLQLKDHRAHFNKSFKFSGRILACHPGGCDSFPTQCSILCVWTSLVAQLVKNLPAMQETACSVEDLGSIPRLGRSPEGGRDNLFHYSCLENPHGLQHGVTKSQT